jgi:cytochrome c553
MNKFFMAMSASIFLLATGVAGAAGNPDNGKAKAATCAGCHGMDGNSPSPQFPKLASQHEEYIVEQLKAFKSGTRQNPIMTGMAAPLSDQDMADLGAYFAQQKSRSSGADPALVPKGEKIYRGGDKTAGVPACMACHSPGGEGNGPALFPHLSGQHAAYVEAQLKAYRDGTRANSPKAQIMQQIAKRMTDDQIHAVASYVQGLYSKP